MTVDLDYSLKSGRLVPPIPFCFIKIALAIRGFLYFHTNCDFIFKFEIYPGSWSNISEYFEICSFIGTKIVEKGAGILTGLAEIITKAIKGLNFLYLLGERRALSETEISTTG